MSHVRTVTLLALTASAFLACTPPSTSAGSTSGAASTDIPDVVATVDGESITKADLEKATAGQLARLDGQIYQIRKVALDNLIGDKLVDKAAKAAGKSGDDFMKAEVDAKLKAPDADTVKKFFEQNKAQMGGQTFDQIKDKISNYLQNSQRAQLEQQLAKKLKDGAKLTVNLKAPRVKIEVGKGEAKGPANAKVTLVEFTDYQCPYCAKSRPAINQVLAAYGDKIRYVLRDFPLSFHQNSAKAHEAAHCAGEQNKYWELNKMLFEHQQALEVPKIKEYAKELKLDQAAFDKCLDDGKFKQQVQDSVEYGTSVGVSGTPSFFVNGIPLNGARGFDDFKKVIDDELAQ